MSATKNFYWDKICSMQEDSIEQELNWIEQQIVEHDIMEKAIRASNMPAFLALNQ